MLEGSNIVNVTGFNNGCAAHCVLHSFEYDFSRINWSHFGCQNLLRNFSEMFGVENPEPAQLRKALLAVLGYANKEFVFGPMIRKHMAEMIALNEEYRNRVRDALFLEVVRAYLADDSSEESDNNLVVGNEDFLETLCVEYESSEMELDDFLEKRQNDILKFYDEQGFDNYISVLGNAEYALFFTADEILNYAQVMNIDLKIEGMQEESIEILEIENRVPDSEKLFSLELVNSTGDHWRYRANFLSEEMIENHEKDVKIRMRDRDPVIRELGKNWEEGMKALIPDIQAVIRGEKPSSFPFLSPAEIKRRETRKKETRKRKRESDPVEEECSTIRRCINYLFTTKSDKKDEIVVLDEASPESSSNTKNSWWPF